MDIRQLRFFLMVCREGSILKASQSAFISQQALSKLISGMETEIGTFLFIRTARGLVPTEIGYRLMELSQPVIDAMDRLDSELSSAVRLQSNNLSLGVACGLQYFLPHEFLHNFFKLHPDILFSVEENENRKCEELVASGDYTAALTIGEETNDSLVSIDLLQRQRIAIVPKSFPLASKSMLHIEDLDDQVLALNINDRCYRRFQALCAERNVRTTNIRIGDSITMFNLCEEQRYIGLTLDYLLQYCWANLHNIVAIPIDSREFPYTIRLVVNSAQYSRKIVQEFVSLVHEGVLSRDEKLIELPFVFQ